ncbi:SLBB domain-containing protein [Myxococcota bacterium]|nr:SLBB domain-containing protein [Myxococcota bacterium]
MQRKGARRHEVLERLEHEPVLDAAAVARVAQDTGVPEADVWGAMRFYSLLSRRDAGLRVCQGLSCKLAGSDALLAELAAAGQPHVAVSCLGQCDRAPAAIGADLHVARAGAERGPVLPDDPELPVNLGGADDARYAALAQARRLGPDRVLAELEAAGLQGRGGAGFPAHLKWRAVRGEADPERTVVCNADEAEPGTFKDRETMLRRPHRVLEGLAIAALVTGARQAWVYVRGEFPACRAALEAAAAQAAPQLHGLTLHFVSGHGAYICGEETALLESIEGKRGMPRLKPPFPTQRGLFGKPTLIHNVETLACVPELLLRGGAWFRARGRAEAGTKLYSISGHVNSPGVYELPLGVTLDELVAVAGGYRGNPRAFSPGGASSGFLPMSMRDTPLDFGSLSRAGSMLGSAGVVVLDDTVDLAWAARQQAVFFEDESCGQCAPCRIGTRVLRQAVDRYLDGGDPAALRHAADVGWEMDEGSICGLGMVASWPLQSARRHFPGDFGPHKRR